MGYHLVDVAVVVVVSGVNVHMNGVKSVIIFYVESVNHPAGLHSCLWGSLYMFFFLVQQLWDGTNSPGPLCKGAKCTVVGR